MSLHDDAPALAPDWVLFRHDPYRQAELWTALPRTQAQVVGFPDGLPLELGVGRGSSSVTAVLRGGQSGPTVLLGAAGTGADRA